MSAAASARVVRFEDSTGPGVPDVAAAAGLLLGVLKASKLETLSQFVEVFERGDVAVELTDQQVALLNRHAPALTWVSVTGGVTTSLAACDMCGEVLYVASAPGEGAATVPSSCSMTLGCSGGVVKAKVAKRVRP